MSNHYSCDFCGKKNVKLWRETYVQHIRPKCATCLEVIEDVDQSGKVYSEKLACRTDQIGYWVPAVYTIENMTENNKSGHVCPLNI